MDYDKALAQLYQNLEEDHTEKAVMACLGIARSAKDYLNSAVLMRELYPNKQEVARMLYDDTSHLNPETRQFLYNESLERWLQLHTLDFNFLDDPEKDDHRVLLIAVGELDAELDQLERWIADTVVPTGIHPFGAAALADQFNRQKGTMRLRIKALHIIKSRIKARCLNYAIQIERQLDLQRKNQGFLDLVQNDVNNFFKARSEENSQSETKARLSLKKRWWNRFKAFAAYRTHIGSPNVKSGGAASQLKLSLLRRWWGCVEGQHPDLPIIALTNH